MVRLGGGWYLAVAHVGQPLPSLLQVAQAGVDHAIAVAGQLAAALVTRARPSQTLVLGTVGPVAQAHAGLWDAPTSTNICMCGRPERSHGLGDP